VGSLSLLRRTAKTKFDSEGKTDLIRLVASGIPTAAWRSTSCCSELGDVPVGPGWIFLSNIDTAMDVFNPDPGRDPDDEIDEMQLRTEVEAALLGLRSLGLLDQGR
jgi:hypothetical protein